MMYYFKLYIQLISKEVARHFTYRANLFSGPISAALMLAMQWALWTALYKTGNAQAASFADTMTYFVISHALVAPFSMDSVCDIIGSDIRSGDIALRLSKPQSYQFTLIGLMSADRIKQFVTVALPMLLIGFFVMGIKAPPSAGVLAMFLLSALLGNILFLLIDLCISYSAFYLTDYWYISWITAGLMQLFGGLLLPLWFYPNALMKVSEVLPFRYVVNMPMDIYLERASALPAIGMQLFWIIVLVGIERMIWRRTMVKLTVQGG